MISSDLIFSIDIRISFKQKKCVFVCPSIVGGTDPTRIPQPHLSYNLVFYPYKIILFVLVLPLKLSCAAILKLCTSDWPNLVNGESETAVWCSSKQ